jgi:hypothetical protein
MTTPSGRSPRGRRDNGLDAPEYAAAADVDPRVGEHLLDVLGLAGIAAYLQPSADLHPVTRTTTLPNRPTDRLFVDRQHLAEARDVIGRLDLGTDAGPGSEAGAEPAGATPAEGPGSAPRRRRREDVDVDAAWREILASWDAPAVEPPPPGSRRAGPPPAGSEPDDRAPDRAGAERSDAGPGTANRAEPEQAETDPVDSGRPGTHRAAPDEAGPDQDGADNRPEPPREERRRAPRDSAPPPITGLDVPFDPDERVEDPDDEGFVPPAPPPVPPASRYTVLAVALLLGGLALFLRPSLLPIGESTSLVLGVAGILGGFATLVWRLRDGLTDDDDDGDDGAIV